MKVIEEERILPHLVRISFFLNVPCHQGMMVVCWRQGSGQAARAPLCHCQVQPGWQGLARGARWPEASCVALSPAFKCNQHV